jgi:predicted DNA-binding protein with PD1-like motif
MSPAMPEPRRHIATPTGFLMVLRRGDDVFARLEALMREEAIPSAFISGLGFAGHVTFGFFDYEKKEYAPKTMNNLELTNLSGTLAWKDGEPSIHAHGTAGDDSFRSFGGHLLALEVGRGSLEISVTVSPTRLERAVDPGIGANVLQL